MLRTVAASLAAASADSWGGSEACSETKMYLSCPGSTGTHATGSSFSILSSPSLELATVDVHVLMTWPDSCEEEEEEEEEGSKLSQQSCLAATHGCGDPMTDQRRLDVAAAAASLSIQETKRYRKARIRTRRAGYLPIGPRSWLTRRPEAGLLFSCCGRVFAPRGRACNRAQQVEPFGKGSCIGGRIPGGRVVAAAAIELGTAPFQA